MDKYRSPINGSTLIREILVVLPHASVTLATYGIHCGACAFNVSETLGEGLNRHAIRNEDAENCIADLNLLYQELPLRSPTVSITGEAALFLKHVTSESGLPPLCSVIVDEQQRLTLETQSEPSDHPAFSHPSMPEVRVSVAPLLLAHVGGAEISVKGERLSIDLPKQECCEAKESCSCNKTGEGAHHGGEGECPTFSLPLGGRARERG